ncbi:MAG: tandem-95 repeat protein [Candidatus Thorarchaeota archaeon]
MNPVNDAPVAFEDEYQIDEDGVLNIPAPGLLINDYDIDGDFIYVDDWSDPGIGYLWVDEDGSFEFIPDPNWNGVIAFEYWVFDGLAHSNVVTVTIFVNSVNDAPVAVDDVYFTDEDVPLNVFPPGVQSNDYDIEGIPLRTQIMTDVSHGTLRLNPDGSFDYVPHPDFFGVDSFSYTVDDGELWSRIATVTITVNSVNDAPIAIEDEYQIDEDVEHPCSWPSRKRL